MRLDGNLIADIFAVIVGAVLIILGAKNLASGDRTAFTPILFGLACFIPIILKVLNVIDLPAPLIVFIVLSLGFHSIGLALGLYTIAGSDYDTLTHTVSSMTMGIIVFYAMMIVEYYSGSRISFSGKGLAIFTCFIALTFSVYWEVIEYLSDVFTSSTAQYSPYDTLGDLVCDTIGTVLASIWVGFYMRKRTIPMVIEAFQLSPRITALVSGKRTE